MSVNTIAESETHSCFTCVWGDVISEGDNRAIQCTESPEIVIRGCSKPCRKWASHRGLSAEWADKSRLPSERAACYKCLCMDAVTIMKHILGNTTIPFRDQLARVAQWEKDFTAAKENDVDVIK